MKAYELIEWLNEHHPQKFAEDWDNVGLLVGDDQKEISHFSAAWQKMKSRKAREVWRYLQVKFNGLQI